MIPSEQSSALLQERTDDGSWILQQSIYSLLPADAVRL